MKWTSEIRLAATDLSNHLACRHLTVLDVNVAKGNRPAPRPRADALVLAERGMEHEQAYLSHLRATGIEVLDMSHLGEADAIAATREAMAAGRAAIAQAALQDGRWFGRIDVLRRAGQSYEVYDCKLARETKAATILQLSLYSDLVAAAHGVRPESMFVVPPGRDFVPEQYRVLDYAAYYRYVRTRLERAVEPGASELYPEPNPHCDVCRWWSECDARWRRDDHLSLVAGISKEQRKQLVIWATPTVAQLAALPLPLQQRPSHGSADSYVRVREQARVQVASRGREQPIHEMLEILPGRGLCRLPEPSLGDVFFDLEGDPFIDNGGREYLFGFVSDDYHDCWALTAAEEKRGFEWFVDYVMSRWAAHPQMHVYHYAAYEPSALKRLMGRYATREDEVDRMLRAGLFVDLRTVVKQSLRAGVEEYSLKALEVFHGFERQVPLEQARPALHQMEHALELGRPPVEDDAVRAIISGYNADDCISTRSLRDWLERERTALVNAGHDVPRPVLQDGAPESSIDERQQRVAKLVEELTRDVPADPGERTEDQAGRWLLANLLDWHRREAKFEWWEYFRLRDSSDEELLDDRAGLAGLQHVSRIGMHRKLPIDRYSFAKQETKIRPGDKVCQGERNIGKVFGIDVACCLVEIRKSKGSEEYHPSAVFVDETGPMTSAMADSLFRLGEWVKLNGLDAPGPYRAARDLLLRRPPRLRQGSLLHEGQHLLDAAKRIAVSLDHSTLAIQGPPGSGKTFTGARMIRELASGGCRIGVTATSHKVIRNLLEIVLDAGSEGLRIIHKIGEDDGDVPEGITPVTSNPEARAALDSAGPVIVAGTPWLWSRDEFRDTVDVLFVDEAGQMSLANVLAVAQASKSIVLLGDPQQLDQPQKGGHPEGAEASALEHLLSGAKTMRPEQGLFLEKTWRLHPKICKFTSEVFYEGRLQSEEGLDQQRIEGHAWLGDSGLWFLTVLHEGNQNSSSEEVDRIADLVAELLRPGVNWINAKGVRRQLTLDDILIIAPYNAQVSDLAQRIPRGRVGTVDKFQGQEAPVVIYSLTTSTPEDAPRGMEFLYSLNRLNVATSRGRALVIVVGNPRLLEPECRSVRQMQLANALCRYAELASIADDSTRIAATV